MWTFLALIGGKLVPSVTEVEAFLHTEPDTSCRASCDKESNWKC